ncbi:MAG: PDC sensor domain-containing protein, partial [Lachnospiraceae bacterium]|nr:PDC sensor domain-containing protein [Lachnospiraceae bacterium]
MNKVHKNHFNTLLLCIAGTIVNLILSKICTGLGLPIFLDMVGTIYVGAVAGYLPGIAVGYLTSLINGIADPTNTYYAFISVLIAVISTFLSHRGFFEKWYKAIVPVFCLAFAGGGIGSVLTYTLYGFGIGEGISAPFARNLYNNGRLPLFFAQLISDFIIDVADKLISVAIVMLLLKATSQGFRDAVYFHGWMQKPLSNKYIREMRSEKTRTMSLRTKIIIIVTLATMVIAAATAGISFLLYHRITVDNHIDVGSSIAALAVSSIDGDKINEYINKGEAAPGYKETEDALYSIKEASPAIQYLYVYKILEDGCHVVFDLDTADTPGGEPGDIIPFDDSFEPYIDDLLAGKEIEPIITNDTFGWLLTVYMPIYDSEGNTAAYACTDVS